MSVLSVDFACINRKAIFHQAHSRLSPLCLVHITPAKTTQLLLHRGFIEPHPGSYRIRTATDAQRPIESEPRRVRRLTSFLATRPQRDLAASGTLPVLHPRDTQTSSTLSCSLLHRRASIPDTRLCVFCHKYTSWSASSHTCRSKVSLSPTLAIPSS